MRTSIFFQKFKTYSSRRLAYSRRGEFFYYVYMFQNDLRYVRRSGVFRIYVVRLHDDASKDIYGVVAVSIMRLLFFFSVCLLPDMQ